MKVLIVIPTYNEVQNIEKLIFSIDNALKGYVFSILFVDDASTDGTTAFIEEMQKKHKNIHILKRNAKYGLASAYIEGFIYGMNLGYEFFIQMDADLSHDSSCLPVMVEKLKIYDVVIGSRYVFGGKVCDWGFLRKLISKGGSFYSRFVLNCPVYDLTGGFNGWSKNILKKIDLHKIISKGYGFQVEMKYRAYKSGAKIIEIPIVFKDRKYGKSKMSASIFFEAFFNTIKLRFRV